MKHISSLPESDQTALEQMHLNSKNTRPRQRAHAVLLSASGYKLDQLADILRADRDTISGWLDAGKSMDWTVWPMRPNRAVAARLTGAWKPCCATS